MDNFDRWAAVLLGIGPLLLLWNRRRVYRRTNHYGVQEFPSFWSKLRAEAFDTALERLGYASMPEPSYSSSRTTAPSARSCWWA